MGGGILFVCLLCSVSSLEDIHDWLVVSTTENNTRIAVIDIFIPFWCGGNEKEWQKYRGKKKLRSEIQGKHSAMIRNISLRGPSVP